MVHEGRLHLLDIRDPRKQGVTLLKNFASSSKINSISLCPRDRTKVAVGLEDHNVHVLQVGRPGRCNREGRVCSSTANVDGGRWKRIGSARRRMWNSRTVSATL